MLEVLEGGGQKFPPFDKGGGGRLKFYPVLGGGIPSFGVVLTRMLEVLTILEGGGGGGTTSVHSLKRGRGASTVLACLEDFPIL